MIIVALCKVGGLPSLNNNKKNSKKTTKKRIDFGWAGLGWAVCTDDEKSPIATVAPANPIYLLQDFFPPPIFQCLRFVQTITILVPFKP